MSIEMSSNVYQGWLRRIKDLMAHAALGEPSKVEAVYQRCIEALRQIAGLVNKSILRYDPNTARFEIHELLRQYAQERLESTPQASDSTKEAYAAYYADFMQDKWKQLRGSEEIPALTEIEADIENVRTAWRYYLDEQNAGQLQKFIYGFWRVYWVRGWFRGAIESMILPVCVRRRINWKKAWN